MQTHIIIESLRLERGFTLRIEKVKRDRNPFILSLLSMEHWRLNAIQREHARRERREIIFKDTCNVLILMLRVSGKKSPTCFLREARSRGVASLRDPGRCKIDRWLDPRNGFLRNGLHGKLKRKASSEIYCKIRNRDNAHCEPPMATVNRGAICDTKREITSLTRAASEYSRTK